MGSTRPVPVLSAEQLVDLLALLRGADSVELKLSVPDSHRRSTVAALGMDPLEAQLRQVVFFDTPDLALSSQGVVLRARRIQRKAGDSIVKLRPVDPSTLPDDLRRDRRFSVEVDAQPGGFVCSGTMKDDEVADADVKEVLAGRRAISTLFTRKQRALVATHTDDVVALDELSVLGPINVAKLKWTPEDFTRRMVAELWFYPDGSRILELSTKCTPADTFTVAAETKAFLGSHGVDLGAEQQTKTRSALEFFARELAGS
jgi:hypothetical protein